MEAFEEMLAVLNSGDPFLMKTGLGVHDVLGASLFLDRVHVAFRLSTPSRAVIYNCASGRFEVLPQKES